MAPRQTTRRQAREWAMQLLFQLDATARPGDAPPDLPSIFHEFWAVQLDLLDESLPPAQRALSEEELFAEGWEDRVAPAPVRRFCEDIVTGVAEHLETIDHAISSAGANWSIDRMGGVERAALRMGAYEILFRADDVPVPVAINEAIDVCKYFSLRDSAHFINGILDHIAHHREPAAGSVGNDAADTWSPDRD